MEERIWMQISVPENFEFTVWFKELYFSLVQIHNDDSKHLKLQIEGLNEARTKATSGYSGPLGAD